MAENVEEIEAKLAAYIDGELTPAERVEIETHLTNNPSHRELLQDLVLHRNLLRSLPREKAPGDCTEGFQGQLERDILLGGDELSRARRRWRIHYSPQLLSAAAIILVAVALGIIVYTVLPPHQPQAPIAHLSTEPGGKGVDALSESSTGPVADTRAFKTDTGEVMARKGVSAKVALNDESLGQKLDEPRFGGGFGGSVAQRQPIAVGDMMVITVTADDVQRANDAVVSYLDLNKINYTAEAQGFWKDGLEAVAAGRRLAAGTQVLGGSGAVSGGVGLETAGAAQVPALRTAEDQVAKGEERLSRNRVDSLRTDAKVENAVVAQQQEKKLAEETVALRTAQEREDRYAKVAARPAPAQAQPTPSPTTQPSAIARGGVEVFNDRVSEKYAAGGTAGGAGLTLLKQQQVRAVQWDQDSTACVILARDMNDQQVRELARSLSQPERNLYATVQMDRSDVYRRTALASLARTGENEVKDVALAYRQQAVQLQAVQLKENEVVREKVFAANAPAVVGPATRPAEELTLNIKANDAGLSRGEADVTARINGTTTGTISPSDYAFAEAVQQPQLPAQQQAFFVTTPTTQPGLDARQNLFTCVIVVQNSTSAAKAAGAATQPIAGKPATAPANPPPAAGEPAK
jgi:hypothetical protein